MLKRFPLPLVCLALLAVALVLAPGCRKKPADTIPAEQPTAPPVEAPPPAEQPREVTDSFPSQPVETQPIEEPSIAELNRRGVLKTVYFEFDRSDLDDRARSTLQANADWMRQNPGYKIVIEGHCDERGTIEYNLALGERRARSVRDYMTSLGVTSGSMRIVSYGEERPVDRSSTESAWSMNRRAEFLIESKG